MGGNYIDRVFGTWPFLLDEVLNWIRRLGVALPASGCTTIVLGSDPSSSLQAWRASATSQWAAALQSTGAPLIGRARDPRLPRPICIVPCVSQLAAGIASDGRARPDLK